MDVEVQTPEDYLGNCISDLSVRTGRIEGIEDKYGGKVIKALVPLRTLFGYVTALRSLTKGRATHTMQFSCYQETPKTVKEQIIAKHKGA